MVTDCSQVPTRTVSSSTRLSLACAAVLAAWQLGLLADQADRLTTIIPDPFSVAFWLAAWTLVLIASRSTSP